MRIGVWLLSLSLLASLAAQEPPMPPVAPWPSPQPEVKPEDQCTVEGMVLNSKTKEPLGKAQVRLMRMGGSAGASNATTTDASGRFKLSGVQPGQYLPMAARNGFVRQVFKSGKTPPSLRLAPKQTLTDLTLELVPAAVIAGRVVDVDGEPLANVQLQAFRYVDMQGERQLMPWGAAASTDDQGAYRMFGLEAGRYYISAAYSERAGSMGGPGRGGPMAFESPASAAPDETYAPVFYPGIADPSQTAPIQLRAGEERRGVDFRLAPVRTIRIRGRLASLSVRPQEVFVMLTPLGGGGAATFSLGPQPPAPVDARGAFEFRGVMPGPYMLAAMSNRDGNLLWGKLPVEAGSVNIDGLELTLKAGVEVKGRVRFDGDSHPSLNLASLTLSLKPERASMVFAGSSGSPLDAEGSFKIRNVSEGDYRVNLNPLGEDAYIKTVKYGDADATRKPLSVGEAPGTLEVILAVAGGRVEGVVTDDDKPVAGALVTAVPESGREDLRKVGQTDQNGRFSVRGLAPGDYTLYACDSGPEGFNPDPKALEAYQDKAKKITVEEQGRATADLTLIHTQDE